MQVQYDGNVPRGALMGRKSFLCDSINSSSVRQFGSAIRLFSYSDKCQGRNGHVSKTLSFVI